MDIRRSGLKERQGKVKNASMKLKNSEVMKMVSDDSNIFQHVPISCIESRLTILKGKGFYQNKANVQTFLVGNTQYTRKRVVRFLQGPKLNN